jgi:hypothetical protein
MSLFDVSDPANPQRLDQLSLDSQGSTVEYDHRAFLYWPATRLAVVPVQQYSYDEKTGVEQFSSGARGFTVRRDGIAPLGEVEHDADRYDLWTAQIRRSMVVDDTLVTISEVGLKVSDLTTFADGSFVRFG